MFKKNGRFFKAIYYGKNSGFWRVEKGRNGLKKQGKSAILYVELQEVKYGRLLDRKTKTRHCLLQ
jgi:hypothetical protein